MINNFNEFCEIIQLLVESLITGKGLNIEDLEEKIRRLGIIFMKVILCVYLYILNKRIKKENCSKCGKILIERKKSKILKTIFGSVEFKRNYEYCSCGTKEFSLDREIKLEAKQQITPGLCRKAVLCGASWGYEESSEKVLKEFIGENVLSAKEIQLLTEEYGMKIGEYDENILENRPLNEEDIPEKIYVDIDGGMVNHKKENEKKDKKRIEGKVCSIWSLKGKISKNRNKIFDKEYLGTFDNYQDLEWDIYRSVMSRTKDIRKTLIIFRGDGARWIRTIYEDNFPNKVYLLDWYHLVKKINDRMKLIITNSKKKREEYSEWIKDELYKGNTEEVITNLKKYRETLSTQEKKNWLDRLVKYLERNKDGMWYERARELGIDIGSGNAEKTVDITICRRLKKRGMSWKRIGVESVLKSRISILNNSWDNYWEDRVKVG